MPTRSAADSLVIPFSQLRMTDVDSVGGKNASLGEMYRELGSQGVKVPNGFAVTAEGYCHFIRTTGLDRRIPELMAGLDTRDVKNLRERGQRVRESILATEMPADLADEIMAAYEG